MTNAGVKWAGVVIKLGVLCAEPVKLELAIQGSVKYGG